VIEISVINVAVQATSLENVVMVEMDPLVQEKVHLQEAEDEDEEEDGDEAEGVEEAAVVQVKSVTSAIVWVILLVNAVKRKTVVTSVIRWAILPRSVPRRLMLDLTAWELATTVANLDMFRRIVQKLTPSSVTAAIILAILLVIVPRRVTMISSLKRPSSVIAAIALATFLVIVQKRVMMISSLKRPSSVIAAIAQATFRVIVQRRVMMIANATTVDKVAISQETVLNLDQMLIRKMVEKLRRAVVLAVVVVAEAVGVAAAKETVQEHVTGVVTMTTLHVIAQAVLVALIM